MNWDIPRFGVGEFPSHVVSGNPTGWFAGPKPGYCNYEQLLDRRWLTGLSGIANGRGLRPFCGRTWGAVFSALQQAFSAERIRWRTRCGRDIDVSTTTMMMSDGSSMKQKAWCARLRMLPGRSLGFRSPRRGLRRSESRAKYYELLTKRW